jgi:hypothetical protein
MFTSQILSIRLTWLATPIVAVSICSFVSAQPHNELLTANSKTSATSPQFAPINPNISPAIYSSKPIELRTLGQTIIFVNPSDYCTVGDSAKEHDLVISAKQILGDTVQLVYFAARCEELKEYRIGRRKTLDHWMQIQLIGNKGRFKRLEVTRDAFLTSVSSTAPKLDLDELRDRINLQIRELNLGLSNISMRPIGRDGNALYMASRSTVQSQDKVKLISAVGGITLVNSLPLSIWVYEVKGAPVRHSQLHRILQQSMLSLITQN